MEAFSVEHIISALSLVLLIGSILYILSRRLTLVPFPLLLFFTGILFSVLNIEVLDSIKLSPESVLYIFLPILLFESAYRFDFKEFSKVLLPSFLFATVGLLFSSTLLAIAITHFFELPFGSAFLFSTVISSTDPIAVLSVFKSLGVPKRLQLLVDGESFLNDATSVILFRILLSLLGIGVASIEPAKNLEIIDITEYLIEFTYVLFGGAIFGMLMGWLYSESVSLIKNIPVVEITLTIVLTSMVFITAEVVLKVSGIVAILTSGLVIGNYGKTKISPKIQKSLHNTWDQLGYITTSIVFILIGYEINIDFITEEKFLVSVSIVALLVSRFIGVFTVGKIYNLFAKKDSKIDTAWLHIANIGGVRGVLPLVIIFSLPESFEYRELFIQLILAAVLFTLSVNTLLIKPLIRFLKLDQPTLQETIEENIIRIVFLNTLLRKLKQLHLLEEISDANYTEHSKQIKDELTKLKQSLVDEVKLKSKNFEDYSYQLKSAIRKYFLQKEKSAYLDLYKSGVISVNLYDRLNSSIKEQVDCIECGLEQFREKRTNIDKKLSKLRKINFSVYSIFKTLFGMSEKENLESVYLYYKARIIGDEKVLEEIKHIFNDDYKLFNNNLLVNIKKKYVELLRFNRDTIKSLQMQYPALTSEFEENIYKAERESLIEELKERLHEENTVSEKALESL